MKHKALWALFLLLLLVCVWSLKRTVAVKKGEDFLSLSDRVTQTLLETEQARAVFGLDEEGAQEVLSNLRTDETFL